MRKLFFILLLPLLWGCLPTQNVDIEFPFEERMTIYGFWTLGRPYELFVGNSLGVNQTGELVALADAKVLLYAEGEQVDSLQFDQDRYFSSSGYQLNHSTSYEIKVSHPQYPEAQAFVNLPAPLDIPTEVVSVIADTIDKVTLIAESWVDTASFDLGYYRLQMNGQFMDISEPLDSLFPGFGMRSSFGINEDRTVAFSIKKTVELFPPFVPEFMVVNLLGVELVAFRYSPATQTFFDYQTSVNAPFGSSELQLVDLGRPGNIDGGYGLFTYYEEVRQRIDF